MRGSSTESSYPALQFVLITNPEGRADQKTVRSHVAHLQHQTSLRTDGHAWPKSGGTRRRRRYKDQFIRLEFLAESSPKGSPDALDVGSSDQVNQVEVNQLILALDPILPGTIGGIRDDPFRSYPIPWHDSLPLIIDHCMSCIL